MCADRFSHGNQRDQNKIEIRLQNKSEKTQQCSTMRRNAKIEYNFVEVLAITLWIEIQTKPN